jgi:hypothetical protein
MVVRRRGSHIFYTIGSQIMAKLSASRSGRALSLREYSWHSFLLRGLLNPIVIVRLERLGQLEEKCNDLIGNRYQFRNKLFRTTLNVSIFICNSVYCKCETPNSLKYRVELFYDVDS